MVCCDMRAWRTLDDLAHEHVGVVGLEGQLERAALVQQHAQRPHVRLRHNTAEDHTRLAQAWTWRPHTKHHSAASDT